MFFQARSKLNEAHQKPTWFVFLNHLWFAQSKASIQRVTHENVSSLNVTFGRCWSMQVYLTIFCYILLFCHFPSLLARLQCLLFFAEITLVLIRASVNHIHIISTLAPRIHTTSVWVLSATLYTSLNFHTHNSATIG